MNSDGKPTAFSAGPVDGRCWTAPAARRQNGAMTLELRRFDDVDGFMDEYRFGPV
jgi:hypothetical protein